VISVFYAPTALGPSVIFGVLRIVNSALVKAAAGAAKRAGKEMVESPRLVRRHREAC
jgi:hypothetical protein